MVKVGVIGSGFMARQHLLSWSRIGVETHIYGRSGVQEALAVAPAESHDYLASLMDVVDVVDICTPTDTHDELVRAAAQRGCHVICEKPLARTVDEALGMLDACNAAGRHLLVGHVVRYFPEYSAFREKVLERAVGNIAVIRLGRESFAPNRPSTNWIFDPARSGGIIGDLMIHDIDYSLWLAGPVCRVHARTTRVASSKFDDHAYAMLTHSSGALTHLTASWAQAAPRFRTRIEIAGSTGLITNHADETLPLSVQFRNEYTGTAGPSAGLPDAGFTGYGDDPFTAELRDFLACIGSGATPRITAEESIEALRVSVAAQESSRRRQPVELGKTNE